MLERCFSDIVQRTNMELSRGGLAGAIISDGNHMKTGFRFSHVVCAATFSGAGAALARRRLNVARDAMGYVDVQKVTRTQFADTSREDADFLGGRRNGLSKKHAIDAALQAERSQ
ncbi:hypothetical protein [Methylocella sp.]|uniref:hypothetical protein n=1 Tax=Methylocella sp. TaxID=1978226 RepID=UPI003782E4B6